MAQERSAQRRTIWLCVLPKRRTLRSVSSAPSPAAAAVIRCVSEQLLDEPEDVLAEVYRAVFAATREIFRTDPSLAAEVTASSRGNIRHWAASLARDPAQGVTSNLSAEVVGIARDAFRLGIAHELHSAYHAGHHAIWRSWMRLAFTASSDPVALEEALDVAAASLARFVDDTLGALAQLLESERVELTRGSHAQKFETVSLVLEGAPMTTERASERLGYTFDGRHTAAVLWSDPRAPDRGALQRAADALRAATDAQQALHVIASSTSMWTWLAKVGEIDVQRLTEVMSPLQGVRLALGPDESGLEGFRRSHLDAVETQRLMQRLPDLPFARFADVELVALVAGNEQRASEFVARTLGSLANGDPELRATLRTYIREHFSASRAARTLFTHRNTVLNRIQRAEEILPTSLKDRGLEIGVALEIARWLGQP